MSATKSGIDAIFKGDILKSVAGNDGVKVTVDAFDKGLKILEEIDPNLVNRIANSLEKSENKDKKQKSNRWDVRIL